MILNNLTYYKFLEMNARKKAENILSVKKVTDEHVEMYENLYFHTMRNLE